MKNRWKGWSAHWEKWSELPAFPVRLTVLPWDEVIPEWRDPIYRYDNYSTTRQSTAEETWQRMNQRSQLIEEREEELKFLSAKQAACAN